MQSPNRLRERAPSKVEVLLLQWGSFDQSRWLNVELQSGQFYKGDNLQIVFSQLTGFSHSVGIEFLENVDFGNGLGYKQTSFDDYRALDIKNVNTTTLFKDSKFGVLPLVQFKVGVSNLSNDPTEENTDYCKITNCIFENLIWSGVPALHVPVRYSLFKNCFFRKSCWFGAQFIFSDIEGCNFQDSQISNATYAITPTVQSGQFAHSNFKKCNFQNAEMDNISIAQCIFEECNFDSASLDNSLGTNQKNEFKANDCSFVGASLDGYGNQSTVYFQDCNFTNATLSIASGTQEFSLCKGNDFTAATITRYELEGDCRWNIFVNTTFSNFSINNSADIRGCDFTDSNLNSIYATKADLIATGCIYDETTLWIDGTPLTD